MSSIRLAASLAALVLVASPVHAASPAPKEARPEIRLPRLGALAPPTLREIVPDVPQTAPEPPAKVSRRGASPEEMPEPLGDLTGFVKVDLRAPQVPKRAAPPEGAAPPRKAAPADPIVRDSAFERFLASAPAAKQTDTSGNLAAGKEAPRKSARREEASKPAAARPAAAAKRHGKSGDGTPRATGNVFARLAGRLSLPFFGKRAARDSAPPRSMEEIAASIRATSEFRKGARPSAAEEIRAEAGRAQNDRDRATALFSAGEYEAAVEAFDRALAVSPKDAALRKFRGLCLASLDRNEEAVDELRRAAELSPDDGAVRIALARALAGRGRAKLDAGDPSGRADLEKALKLDPASRVARRALQKASAASRADRG